MTKMRFPFSLKTGAIAAVIAAALLTAGVYVGAFYWEREGIKKELEASVLRTALNLQAIGYIRDGKATEAIDLLSSMNDGNLVYLMRYEDLESDNPEFARRKKKVLAALSKERADHPRTSGSFKSDPEWQQYQRDLENYLKQNQ
jgi:hypothetical protein